MELFWLVGLFEQPRSQLPKQSENDERWYTHNQLEKYRAEGAVLQVFG